VRKFDPNFISSDELDLYTLPYRLSVGMMVFNKDGKVFLVRRFASKNGAWQMLQGDIRDNETVREAGLRWLYEELNMIDLDLVFESNQWLYHDFNKFLAKRLWEGQYRGQKQKWLLLGFMERIALLIPANLMLILLNGDGQI
jgi:putative (di)nucleoside polyphosphate hydrolase